MEEDRRHCSVDFEEQKRLAVAAEQSNHLGFVVEEVAGAFLEAPCVVVE